MISAGVDLWFQWSTYKGHQNIRNAKFQCKCMKTCSVTSYLYYIFFRGKDQLISLWPWRVGLWPFTNQSSYLGTFCASQSGKRECFSEWSW